ncbi:MAG: thioredoxin [Oscillospiraceae bacterium]|nr:thioredoxin [Oscillospiraceae bacterium]
MAEPPKNQKAVRLVLLAVAVLFIFVGIRNGSMNAVINKAIRICTECVGLG